MKESPDKKNLDIPDDILDKWQKIVNIMVEVIDVPAGLIMKVEGPYIEVLQASQTEDHPYQVGDREHLAGLYCETVISEKDKLVAPNALEDEKWKDNPDVERGMISYLGYPLLRPDGKAFGTICVLDSEENTYSVQAERLMSEFKEIIESHLGLLYQRQELEKEVKRRKEVEKTLEKSEKKFRTITEHSQDGIVMVDDKYHLIYVNPRICEIIGYSESELIGRDFRDFLDKESELPITERYEKRRKGEDIPAAHKLNIVRKDGQKRCLETRATLLEGNQGNVQTIAHIRDITERKQAEEELLEERNKLEELHKVVDQLQRCETEDNLWDQALQAAKVILELDLCIFYIAEEDKLVPKAVSREALPEGLKSFDLTEGVVGKTLQSGETIQGEDLKSFKEAKPARGDIRAFISVPIGDIGVLQAFSTEKGAFSKQDVNLAEILSGHLREEVKRARLERQLRQKADSIQSTKDKLERLHTVTRKLESASAREEIYQLTVNAAEEILDFLFCNLGIVEGDRIVTKATSSGLPPSGTKTMAIDEGLSGKTYRTRKTYLYGDIRQVEDAQPVRSEYRSFISTPIGDIGVFQVVSNQIDAFTEEDARLVELLVGHLFEALRRVQLEDKLKERAIRDSLTGLFNRRYFNETLQKEVERSKRGGRPLAFLMLDVNRFKEINDSYSHQTGDKILQEVANLLKENVRSADIVIRYGGDEFLIILPETNGEASKIINRIRKELEKWNQKQDILDFPLTLAIGSSYWDPGSDLNVEEALKKADREMYEDKSNR